MYDSTPYNYESSSAAADPALAIALFGFFVVIGIISYIVNSIFMGMLFKKAGVEAWKAWVPIYNIWVFLELGGQKGWISLLYLTAIIPIIGGLLVLVPFVFSCIAAHRIGLNFGKESVFVLLYIFLTPVWLIWLAVDKTAVWKPLTGGTATTTPPSQPAAM